MEKTEIEILERYLRQKYNPNWVEAMLIREKIDAIVEFMERNKDIPLRYEQVFFSPNGFDVYESNGEKRIFCAPNELFPLVPLDDANAKGDWQKWLKTAKKVREIR